MVAEDPDGPTLRRGQRGAGAMGDEPARGRGAPLRIRGAWSGLCSRGASTLEKRDMERNELR